MSTIIDLGKIRFQFRAITARLLNTSTTMSSSMATLRLYQHAGVGVARRPLLTGRRGVSTRGRLVVY